ncbi:MAG: type II toxin-antitoxin system death-on-curing family toxin [Bacteroidota bacterium]
MSSPAEREPVWLTEVQTGMLHANVLNLFGGLPGIRGDGLLQRALARPQHLRAYGGAPSLFDLAAAYAFGLAKNHPFADGNKRVAFLAIRVFLFRNGHSFRPDEVETVVMMEGVASGTVDGARLSEWIRASSETKGE